MFSFDGSTTVEEFCERINMVSSDLIMRISFLEVCEIISKIIYVLSL